MRVAARAGKGTKTMRALMDCFEIAGREVVTAVGSGGKTALMWRLAQDYKAQKVLVTTTTKFHAPYKTREVEQLFRRQYDHASLPQDRALPGVTLAGSKDPSGKLKGLPAGMLERVAPLYQKVLIEGDGSRTCPLKGWESYEPVVPDFTTMTIGVIPIWQVGGVVSKESVHRLPLFTKLTGARVGDTITLQHVAHAIAGREGCRSLMSEAKGRRVVFINQVENNEELGKAVELLSLLPETFLHRLDILVAGSVWLNTGEVLWKKEH